MEVQMSTKTAAAEVADQLEAGFPPVTDPDDCVLARTLFRLLAEGAPVEAARLAGVLGRPETEISEALAGPAFESLVYSDDRGRVIGFSGLGTAELGETVHRLSVNDQEVYAWCARDALFLPHSRA
jgi:Helix-turn-helix domain of alkylmercury lyase/Alkylmercury lyase